MSHDLLSDLAFDTLLDRDSLPGMDDACVTAFRFFVCDLVGIDAELSVVNDTVTDRIASV